jgi:hypothetical protein
LAVALLSVLLAATRQHPMMRLASLVSLQNGVALAGALGVRQPFLPLACLLPPLLFAAGLTVSQWYAVTVRGAGTIALGAAGLTFVLSIVVPLDPLGSLFAPVIAFRGAWHLLRRRHSRMVTRSAAAVLQLGGTMVAVCAESPMVAWTALTAAAGIAVVPGFPRREPLAVLVLSSAGLAVFGLLMPPGTPWSPYPLYAGFAAMAACVPDLALPVAVVVLRAALHEPRPAGDAALLTGIAVVLLVACTVAALIRDRTLPKKALLLINPAIALMPIAAGLADGRFAGILALLFTAFYDAAGPALAGREVMVLPGLALVTWVLASVKPLLLLPVGCAMLPVMLAFRLPRNRPPLPTLVPLALAVLLGVFARGSLAEWLHALALNGR